ncbi:MAG: hypothetical protein JJT78_09610 [Leptospira sp.]|nr:hypothetical protein [Leptospira sp.]
MSSYFRPIHNFWSYLVIKSSATLIWKVDEASFEAKIYSHDREFKRKRLDIVNSFFTDRTLVIVFPTKEYKFKNLVLSPIGTESITTDKTFYFNTLFFDPEFQATSGIIAGKKKINEKIPRRLRISIDNREDLAVFSIGNNNRYNDVLQVPFQFWKNTMVKTNFRNINYRHFLSFKNGNLYYITGYNNSLISWIDIKDIMNQEKLTTIIPIDGGSSLDYEFKGAKNTYSFSSIPLRGLWYTANSPYYIQGTKK